MVKRVLYDQLWLEHMGAGLDEEGELARLRWLRDMHELSWDQVYELYLRSKYWRRIRREVLDRDDHRCVKCKAVDDLHVDHIAYGEMGEEDLEKLQTLCLHCHAEKTEKVDLLATSTYVPKSAKLDGQLFTVLRMKSDDEEMP